MKKSILLLLIVSISIFAFSQEDEFEKVNFKTIKKAIKKKKSDFYYPHLMEKFKNGDTTLTLSQKRHLYYGYIYQDGYSPYGMPPNRDSLKALLEKPAHEIKDYHKIIKYCDQVLESKPFDLSVMNYKLYAYEHLDFKNEFEKQMSQVFVVFDAIFSSGDGVEKETAFCVIYISNEYDVLNYLDFEFKGQALIDHYDYMQVSSPEYEIEGLYFDISAAMNTLKF